MTPHYTERVSAEIERRFGAVCVRLERKGFNPYRFAQKSLGRGDHPEAVLKALERLDREFALVKRPWAYLERIMSVESGKFNARDYAAKAKAEKKDTGLATVGTSLAAALLAIVEQGKTKK